MGYGGRREDVGARVMRFDYMERMDEEEADQHATSRQRVEAYKRSLPPIEPDRTVKAQDGSEVKVYRGSKAREIVGRQREAYRISQEGAR
jgi:hypothetical protein